VTHSTISIAGQGPLAVAIAARMVAAPGMRVIIHGFGFADGANPKPPKYRIERAANLFDLASECEAVIAVYDTHQALRDALTGTQDRPGLLGALQPGSLIVDLSGGTPEECRRLAGQLAGRAIGLVEAAIIGGTAAVTAGNARIFAGGYGEHVHHVAPALACLGSVKRIGPQGSARMYVALSESVRAAHHIALAEAQAIAAASGFVPEDLATPPLSHEEHAHLAARVSEALAQAPDTPTPLLAALAGVFGIAAGIRQP
jgi:3-hydroxyisobutyrate dehydrogenase